MKCRICGRECPPAAKICRDCASARKRAFAATVTQPLLAAVGAPSVAEPRFVPRPTRRRTARAANDPRVGRVATAPRPEASLPLTVVPRRHGRLWFAVAAIMFVAVDITLLRRVGIGTHVSDDEAPTPPPAAGVVPSAASAPPAPSVAAEAPPELPAAEESAVKTVMPRHARKPMPRVEAPTPAAAEPTPPAEPAPVARAPAPPRVVEAPRQDPWQALNEGLARCGREGILERMSCEQRLRSQYCGGSWGLVPQCPIGPATDHGQ